MNKLPARVTRTAVLVATALGGCPPSSPVGPWGGGLTDWLLPSARAAGCGSGPGFYHDTCLRIARVAAQGDWDFYATGYAWHIDGYSSSYRASLNANAWGAGLGKHWTDADGNEDVLFAFVFRDSHKHPEPIGGYARQWYTRSVLGGLSVGGGFFAGVTARQDIAHYLPVPIAAPIASVRYRHVSAMAAFMPRIPGFNKGDVAFFWARYAF
jgi:palmitoyl transferase